ncbi:heterokaryon incompatibility protein het-E-1 [Fusarium sp. NRRL 52700]|nr:heterokaryon incompatibility protein het-E-1 [Fusarium sp. NRRL 52700]
MIPHQTLHPRHAGGCAQVKESTAITDLENAVARFQASLTDEDRQRLKDLKKLPHDPQSIIVFTAELDMQQCGKRRGKSIASRLTSFLQIVQQFTPIIDTYIQSNPDISAIIWSSIKLTFMFLANFLSQFQSFVDLLEGFGSIYSRLGHYQILFQDSTRLNDSICEFHTSIIHCCEKVIYLIRQSSLANQVWKAITGSFQTDIKNYVEDVKVKAENAQCEIELAKAQADYQEQQHQTKERQNASDYRRQLSAWATKYSAAMKDLQDLKEKHCKDKKRLRIINELTSYNFMPTFNSMRNKRYMGTAEWCFHTPEYREWANANKSAVLHITGKRPLVGSGKTILASSIIERLCCAPVSRQFTSFFFLRFDESKSLSSSTVIRSCLQQLLTSPLIENLDSSALSDLDDRLQEAKASLFSAESLRLLFTTASKNLDDWFIVIDGLDEVDIIRQIGLLKFLREVLEQLPEPQRIKLLLSSRETSSSDIDRLLPQVTRLYTGLKPTSADIRLYAEDIITSKISTNELIVNDPRLAKEILEVIYRKEKGIRALQDIPSDLPATFDRALGRIAAKNNDVAIVQKAFTLIQASLEPLTLSQLREALSVDIGQQTLDHDDLVSGIDRLPMWCENLICIEAADTVHFSHHSIQKYLLDPGSEAFKNFHLERDKCDRFMGELCVTYISLDNFQRALGFTRKCNTDSSHMNINMGELAEQTIRNAFGDSIGSFIGRFTREAIGASHTASPGKVQRNGSMLSSIPKPTFGPAQSSKEYTFFDYASKHWYKHQLCIDSNENEATWRLLGQILRKPRQYSQGEPWFQPAWTRAVSETIGNDVLFFGPGFDSYRETAVSLETDENGRLMKTSTLRDLCYVFIYAIQNRNAGLACRVFMLLVEDYKRPANRRLHGYLSVIINRMAVNKLHQSCENRCLSRARLQLSHSDLVRELRAAVASGISFFPPLAGNETQQDCTCLRRAEYPLREEMCQLLETGYRRHEEPFLFPFSVLAEELDTGSSVERLRTLNYDKRFDVELILSSKTRLGRSFFDILIEGALIDMKRMQVFLSERLCSQERPRDQDNGLFGLLSKSNEDEHVHLQRQVDNTLTFLGTVQAAATNGIETIEKSLEKCMETGGSVPLHKATITLLFDKILLQNRWPTSICEGIVKVFFGESLIPDYEEAIETVLSLAIHSNSWELAVSLIDMQPVSIDEREAAGDISYIKQALRCRDCRGIAMQMPKSRKKWSFDLRMNRWYTPFHGSQGLMA